MAIYDQLAEKSSGPNRTEVSLQVREGLADLQALLAKAELHAAAGEHEDALVLYSRWRTGQWPDGGRGSHQWPGYHGGAFRRGAAACRVAIRTDLASGGSRIK